VLNGALKNNNVKHRAAITNPSELGRLLQDVSCYNGSASVEYALRILPYVFVKPGEQWIANWQEIDFEGKLWRIPVKRMKMSSPHLFPLSMQVPELLVGLKKRTGNSKYLIPN
jgi:integrase